MAIEYPQTQQSSAFSPEIGRHGAIMNLTRRERMKRAVTCQPIDRLPTQVNYTAGMGQRMAAHFASRLGKAMDIVERRTTIVEQFEEHCMMTGGRNAKIV